ncbi:hypothetical protein BU17DRAFT_102675 [Hysterangium stoloniferum]|nr:hypothetical protein BU17DRAFT_102675 [Hysterangium stoloniferum]
MGHPHQYQGVPTLLINTKGSLKTLHISYDFTDHVGERTFEAHNILTLMCPLIASQVVETGLETYSHLPVWYDPRFETETQWWPLLYWQIHDLAHMIALKRLHISDMFIHRRLLVNPPPFLTTLIIAVHDPVRRPIDFSDLFEILPSTVRTLICEVGGKDFHDQWVYLAKHAEVVHDSHMVTPVAPVPEGEIDVESSLNLLPIATAVSDEAGLIARMQALKKLVARMVRATGIDFRLEPLRGESRFLYTSRVVR